MNSEDTISDYIEELQTEGLPHGTIISWVKKKFGDTPEVRNALDRAAPPVKTPGPYPRLGPQPTPGLVTAYAEGMSSPQRRIILENSDDTVVSPEYFVGIVKPQDGRQYPGPEHDSPDTLPPLKPGYVRLLHRTSRKIAYAIKETGLNYGGQLMLGSTARGYSNINDIEWTIDDPRFRSGYIVVMDVPNDEWNSRVGGRRHITKNVRPPVRKPTTPVILPSVDQSNSDINDVW